MAVQNSLLKQEDKKKSLVMEFKAGDENVKLSPRIVKSYLVSGDAEKGCFLAGQVAGLITKEQPAKEIIEEVCVEAEKLLKGAYKWVN